LVGDFMDKKTHEILKGHLKENEGNGFISLTAPEFWMEAKPAFWMNE